jgi:multiple RNA-binding domain-containing protein 1
MKVMKSKPNAKITEDMMAVAGQTATTSRPADDEDSTVPVLDTESDDEFEDRSRHRRRLSGTNDPISNPPTPQESEQLIHMAFSSPEERLSEFDIAEVIPGAGDGAGQNGDASDADWLRSRTSRLLGLVDEDEERRPVEEDEDDSELDAKSYRQRHEKRDVGPQARDKPTESQPQDPTEKVSLKTLRQEQDHHSDDTSKPEENADEMAVLETGRLFLRNLPYNVVEDGLRDHFSQFGPVEEVCRLFSLIFRIIV